MVAQQKFTNINPILDFYYNVLLMKNQFNYRRHPRYLSIFIDYLVFLSKFYGDELLAYSNKKGQPLS